MYCQLDQVKEILAIGAAVRSAVMGYKLQSHWPKSASAITCGLLLRKNLDAFIQKGKIHPNGVAYEHFWVEVYLDGEPFLFDVTIGLLGCTLGQNFPDVMLVPRDEADELYGEGFEYEWSMEDCPRDILQTALNALGVAKSPEEVLKEIAASY
ncbi:hypothetical protein [Desulforamulus aquiferis]|uniref:Uncharacterized protein n=1 Tax=Desulforamulus aquiferis TaxID=1397668 RepID=A0AAW7ZEG7_9FIRM|nr:hypothetical protein [Desulforamulus aquiferis]MDO7787678.1 hypothetical protein [Desulforamulus aquiferis]